MGAMDLDASRPPDFIQHALPQDAVRAGLVSLARLLQPGDNVGIEAHGNGLLYRTIEPAPHRVRRHHPVSQHKLSGVFSRRWTAESGLGK